MKKVFAGILLGLFSLLSAHAQWDLEHEKVDLSKYRDYAPSWNPNWNLMVPGAGTTSASDGMSAKRATRQKDGGESLPERWNNAETIYFPPVFHQAGGSCGVASRVGYMLNLELNAYRGTNASLAENHLAPNFQYPFSYNGTEKEKMAMFVGYPDAKTYGGFPYSDKYGMYEVEANNAGWMQGYENWHKAMFNRIKDNPSFPLGCMTEEGMKAWKRYLYNHNGDESFSTGGVIGLGCAAGSAKLFAIPQTAANDANGFTGKYYWVTGTKVDHAVICVGWDDRVQVDLDNNGTAGETLNANGQNENGAWIIVNSWGNWANDGFAYVPYALATPTCTVNETTGAQTANSATGWTGELYAIRKDYVPQRTIKLRMDFSQRSALSLKAGVSANLNATEPDKTVTFHHFNYQGDGSHSYNPTSTPITVESVPYEDPMVPMLGLWADGKLHDEPMEFGYDLTDLCEGYDLAQPLKFFFIVDTRANATGTGNIYSASIIDYSVNPNGVETTFDLGGSSLAISNAGARTMISTVVSGDVNSAPTNVRLEGSTLSWAVSPSASVAPVSFIVYRNDEQLSTTTSLNYATGGEAGTYSVMAVYDIDGREVRSSKSAEVKALSLAADAKYISRICSPVTDMAQITDGMTVVLYNYGRARYNYDNGAGNIYLSTPTAPQVLTPDDYKYVFTLSKSGSNYTLKSLNGYLAGGQGNNATYTPAATPTTFVLAQDDSNPELFSFRSGSFYLEAGPNHPLGWNSLGSNAKYKILPVDVSVPAMVSSLGNAITSTAQLTDGGTVVLKNKLTGRYLKDCGYGINYSTSDGFAVGNEEAQNYVFTLAGSGSSNTITSRSGGIPTIVKSTRVKPSATAQTMTFTYDGTKGAWKILGSTTDATYGYMHDAKAGGNYELVGWATGDNASFWELYPAQVDSKCDFTINVPSEICAGVVANFSLTGNDDIVDATWTIDGETYHSMSPAVKFETTGTKSVSCTVTNHTGTETTKAVNVTVLATPALTADFTLSSASVVGDSRISFAALNTLSGCTYEWSMPDADIAAATTRSASASYSTVGEKSVTLTVTAPGGATSSETKYFNVLPAAPLPDYEVSKAVIIEGQKVSFSDCSKYAPTSWRWDLVGESNIYTSLEQNPVFAPKAGVYELRLKVTNTEGSNLETYSRALIVCKSESYQGLSFRGGDQKLTTTLPNDITTAWTIDYWLNPISLSNAGFGLTCSAGLTMTSDGAGKLTLKNGATTIAESPTNFYKLNEWHHYAIKYSGGRIYFYRDASEVANVSCSLADFTGKFSTLQIGGSSAPATGMFDEFRVWSQALSADQIKAYALQPISDVEAAENGHGLELYYQFNQVSGNAVDATSHNATGTRQNFGPDGDAWTDSKGVFCLSDEVDSYSPVGELLDNGNLRVIDYSDEEVSTSETNPARFAVDGTDYTLWHSRYSSSAHGYPHYITLSRNQLDNASSLVLHYGRGSNYRAKTLRVEESDDNVSWDVVDDELPLLDLNNSFAVFSHALTKKYVRLTFLSGYGSYLALNEIKFYGAQGYPDKDVLTTPTEVDLNVYTGNLTPAQSYSSKWTHIDYPEITFTQTGNNINWYNGGLNIYTGSGTVTYTINAASPFAIAGYSFEFYNKDNALTVTPAGQEPVTAAAAGEWTAVNVDGLSNVNSTTFTVGTLSGQFVALRNFKVKLADDVCTVEYKIVDSKGNTLFDALVPTLKGSSITDLPESMKRDFCSYSLVGATATEGLRVSSTCTMSLPFVLSEAGDTTFYHFSTRNGEKYFRYDAENHPYTTTSTPSETSVEPSTKWAFFGNPYAGFYLTNAATGATKYLRLDESPSTIGGKSSYAVQMADVPTRWKLSQHNTSGFVLSTLDESKHVNDFAGQGKLSTWETSLSTAKGDPGSLLRVHDLGDFAGAVVSEAGPFMTTNVGSGYVASLSNESKTLLQSEYTARSAASTYAQYRDITSAIKNALIKVETGKFYRLKNVGKGTFAYLNPTDSLLYVGKTADEAQSLIGSIVQFEESGDGTYAMLWQGLPMYGVNGNYAKYGVNPVYRMSQGLGATQLSASRIEFAAPGEVSIYGGASSRGDYGYLHAQGDGAVVSWSAAETASKWNIIEATSLNVLPSVLDGVGYTTLYLPFAATINPDDAENRQVNFYILESKDGDELTTTLVDDNVIPANTGVLLRSVNGAATVHLALGGTPTADTNNNVLEGNNFRVARDDSYHTYCFSTALGAKSFYDYTGAYVPANKAYLTDRNGAVHGLLLNFGDDDITSIPDIANQHGAVVTGKANVFDLQGRRVSSMQRRGFYIVNGKKIIKK